MSRVKRFIHGLSLTLLLAIASCSGDGTALQAGVADLQIFLLAVGGADAVPADGLVLGEPGDARSLAVFRMEDGQPTEDLSDEAVWQTDDPSVVSVDRGVVTSVAEGDTSIHGLARGQQVSVSVRVVSNSQAALVDFWIVGSPRLVVHSLDQLAVMARGALKNGATVDVGTRLDWDTSDVTVVEVRPGGTAQPQAEGIATLRATNPVDGLARELVFVVALPQPSGAMLPAATGGLVTNNGTSAYVPPGALAVDAEVTISDPIPEAFLPAPVPQGETYLAGVELTAAGQHEFAKPVDVRIQIPQTTPGELTRVFTYRDDDGSWIPTSWGHVAENGTELVFETTTFSQKAVVRAPGKLQSLAMEYAPHLVVSQDDTHPISYEHFREHTSLRRRGSADEVTPVPADEDLLSAYNEGSFYLALNEDVRRDFSESPVWGAAHLGGMAVRKQPPYAPDEQILRPTMYWVPLWQEGKLVLQYWMLYAVSGKPYMPEGGYKLWHEGDLEMVQVILDVSSQDDPTPIAATASQHYYGEGRHWRDVTVENGTHLLIFVSEAGHASYFDRGFGSEEDKHGTWELGLVALNQGFFFKVNPGKAYDRCPERTDNNVLKPESETPDGYRLELLLSDKAAHEVLLYWKGKLGLLSYTNSPGQDGVPSISARWPGPNSEGLGMFYNPLPFHYAFNFSTENAIRAYDRTNVDIPNFVTDVEGRVDLGRCLFDLQRFYAVSESKGPVQLALDGVASLPGSSDSQPELLANFLKTKPCEPARYLAGLPQPLIPQQVFATSLIGGVKVSWPEIGTGREYSVSWSTTPGTAWSIPGVSTPIPEMTVAPLVSGRRYYFAVREVGSGGDSPASREVSAVAGYGTPEGVTATPGDGAAEVSWDPVPNASGYFVYWSDQPITDLSLAQRRSAALASKTIVGLTNQRFYYFAVTATQDGIVESSPSTEVFAVPESSASGGLKAVVVDTRFITLTLYDHITIDGDQIDVYVNGELVLENHVLVGPPGTTLQIALASGANTIRIHADNEGSLTPNTAAVDVSDVIGGSSLQTYLLKTNEDAVFTIVAP